MTYRRQRADMLQTFKIIKKIDKVDGNHFLPVENSNTRGHSHKLSKPRAKTRLRQHYFSHRIINNWNSLSDKVVCTSSINSFKDQLEDAWSNSPLKYNI